jgi:hypothetical protein
MSESSPFSLEIGLLRQYLFQTEPTIVSLKPNKKDVYYENFSKFALNMENGRKKQEIYTYSEWASDNTTINKVPLKVLKNTLKTHKCPIYGNKPVLIIRLWSHYLQIKSAITIQRIFRGFIVRELERSRGPAATDLTICTNDTDFETMNPLSDIPAKYFFSYRDRRGFVYGFNMCSLIKIFETNSGKLVNPYNREDIPFDVLKSLFGAYSKLNIIYELPPHI